MDKAIWINFLLSLSLAMSAAQDRGALEQRRGLAAAPGGNEARHNQAVSINPQQLYYTAWKLVKDDYYDQSFNGQRWERWRHLFDGKLKTADDSHKAVETMLASLGDRYTRFLDRDAFSDERSQIDAHLYGIGVQIGLDKTQKVIVIAPLEGTPAARAGLMPADEIAEIDGKSTKGLSIEEAAQKIRGPIRTSVTLTILRGKERRIIALTRAEIPVHVVQTAKVIDGDVGYIRLTSFISQQTNEEVLNALKKITQEHAQGLILDLRDNPGGLLTSAIDISNMFLDHGNIVSTVDRDGYKTPAPSEGNPVTRLPLVVLINQGSASASEIASGALRDNGRAVLVGQKSFGKGLVQGINRLEDGSGINITIARYLTPNDTDINKIGIVPDVPVELSEADYKAGKGPWWMDPAGPSVRRSPEDLKDIQLSRAIEVLKQEIANPSTIAHWISERPGT